MRKPIGPVARILTLVAATALSVSACGQETSDDAPTPQPTSDETPTPEPRPDRPISLGILPAWTDGLATAHLWQAILEDEGYEVEITEISDPAALYVALTAGEVDVYPSAWPEETHATYLEQHGNDLEDLGAYYENARLSLAVPAYTDIDSITDLSDDPGRFGGQIIGIEPGAGLTVTVQDQVFPAYGLDDDFALVPSSTAAMLTELQAAIAAQEDIVVTLWRPFWPYAEYPLKDLADPEGALGEPETLNLLARTGFSDEFPEVAAWMAAFHLDDEQFAVLDDFIVNRHPDDPAAGARAWIDANPEVAEAIKN